jgi:hypothetical protein
VTNNPYLKRLLGEASDMAVAPPPKSTTAQAGTPMDNEDAPEAEDEAPEAPQAPQNLSRTVPNLQELVTMWQRGEHMGVAAKLMFTEANYVDFVDLVFQLGHAAGRELGSLLDELADTEGMEPPETPPEYQNLLQRVGGAAEEEAVV